MRLPKSLLYCWIVATGTLPALAATAPRLDVQFVDPSGLYAEYHADLRTATVAAGQAWTQHIEGDHSALELTVLINFVNLATASGRSLTSGFVGLQADGSSLWQQGAAHELLTGLDVNGDVADIEFNIGINGYLQSELWFDPEPLERLQIVPADRTDAVSVLMHEWGHALGFNGWMDGSTGLMPGTYASTFDAHVVTVWGDTGPTLYFQGPQATALHGSPVPLSWGNYAHVGNSADRDGADLLGDLMNGVSFARGTRYRVSALDLAIMSDLGLPIASAVPELAPLTLWLSGLAALGLWTSRGRHTLA